MVILDPLTIGVATTSLLALDPVKKLLGPTADFLGAELAAYTRRRFSSAEKIIEIAAQYVDSEPDGKSVSSRVLLAAIEEGSKVESEIAQKYFGGVLASSRAIDGNDDSAIIFTSILAGMSSSQIKLHYTLYSGFRKLWLGSTHNLGQDQVRSRLHTVLPYGELAKVLGPNFLAQLENGMFGLYRIGLSGNFGYGEMMENEMRVSEQYLHFEPTVLGCNLFLAANGQAAPTSSGILDPVILIKDLASLRVDKVLRLSDVKKPPRMEVSVTTNSIV